VPRNSAQTQRSGTATPDGSESVGLVCNEVWGGNRAFYGPVELPGLRGVLYSQASDGTRGGDVHYLSVCGSGLISRACLADVTGHGESVAAISETMHDLLRRSVNRMDERKVLQRLNVSPEAGCYSETDCERRALNLLAASLHAASRAFDAGT
jgi:serine phosphatase RsbU (regulator of sigma subunit)